MSSRSAAPLLTSPPDVLALPYSTRTKGKNARKDPEWEEKAIEHWKSVKWKLLSSEKAPADQNYHRIVNAERECV